MSRCAFFLYFLARFRGLTVYNAVPGLAAILLFLAAPCVHGQSAAVAFNSAGLSSLQYNGTQFLSDGRFYLNQITFQNSDGSTYAGSTSGTATVDMAGETETLTYAWGTIVTNWSSTGNRVNGTVTVNNQSTAAISEIWFQPISFVFPSSVSEYDGNTPLLVTTLGQPAVQTMSYSGGVMALAADDITLPLQLGYPLSNNRPTSTIFPLLLNTGKVSSNTYPTSLPTIARPIAAGSSDQYHFSVRFGPVGSTRYTLADDTFQAFASAYPPVLSWTDHRSVGALFLATSGANFPTNPRGWFFDPTVDVTSPAGVAALRTRILNYAQTSVSILQSMNAQGMVTWDIEGEQFPNSTSYVCDPTVFAQAAPEMAGIADDYFGVFRNAGLKVGVCLRPQQFVLSPDGSSAQQNYLTDPGQITQLLIEKASYARSRWGATLFYVDSNVNGSDGNTLDASIFANLQAAFPDSLFFPEHASTEYWAYDAPYKQLNQGYTSTPADPRFVYPNAFSLINTADGAIQQQFPALVQAVSQGDLMLYRGWFDDEPAHSLIQSIYQTAAMPGVQVFVTPPSVLAGASQAVPLTSYVAGGLNQQVTWSVPSGVGSVSASGVYTAPATFGGSQNITVVAISVADSSKSASATVTLEPAGVPITVSANSGSGQNAVVNTSFANTLVAKVTDINNNPVSGVAVTFTAPPSTAATPTATFAGGTTTVAMTDANGLAVSPVTVASATSGAYSVTASVSGVSSSASFSLANNAGNVAAVVVTSGSGQSTVAGTPFANPLRATVTDGNGNPVPNVMVSFSAPTTGASGTLGAQTTINVVSGSNGVAAVPVVANGLAGNYAVLASVASVATPASFALTNIAATSTAGVLSGVANSSFAAVNLTAEGTADWVHWETGYQDRKSGVSPQISTYTVLGGSNQHGYTNDTRAVSWTDGTPRTSMASDTSGVYAGGALNGFTVTVPADSTPRTLTLHVGGYNSSGLLTATLSDGSAAVYSDTTALVSTQYDRNYTITYQAASAGQALTVSWVLATGPGNVTLNAAALSAISVIGTAGTPQSTAVNTAFGTLLQATVTDANNNPVAGVTVNFTAASGAGASATFGGSTTGSAMTGSNGVATAPSLVANSVAGSYTLTASVPGMPAPAAAFLLTNVAGPPANFTVISGTPQSVGVNSVFGTPLSVGLSDASSNPVSGANVSFTVQPNGAGATFGGAAAVTTTTYKGTATAPALVANGQGGTFTVTASVTGLSPLSFTLTNVAKTAASITAMAGTPQSAVVNAGFANTLEATVTDSSNRPVSGITVTFSAPASGPSANFAGSAMATAVTNVFGVALSPALTANGQTGSYAVSASAAGVTAAAQFNLTNAPVPPPGTLSGSGTSVATVANLTSEGSLDWVHWGDGALNRKAGVTAQISSYAVVGAGGVSTYHNDLRPLSWSDGAPVASAASNTNGVYINSTGNGFLLTAPADTSTRKLIVHVGGFYSGGTLTASLSDGSAPAYMDVTTNISGQYDRNYTLIYSAGNAAQTLNVKWVMNSGSGNVTLNGAALSTSAPSVAATAGTPQSTAIGSSFPTALQVTVVDANQNPLSGATVTFSAPATGASATFNGSATATTSTNNAGVATAPALTANSTAGAYNVTASAPGATAASFNLTNTVGAPASVTAALGTPQSATVNSAFATPLQVTVADSGDNPVSGVTVTFATPASGASAAFSNQNTVAAVTNASGVATAPAVTANGQTGAYSVSATVGSLHATFNLTNVAGAPASIAASGGTPQSTAAGSAFATSLQAVVKDGGGNLLSGVVVTFTSPASGASAAFGGSAMATATTNVSGVATAPALTANTQAGAYSVLAAVGGVSTQAAFSLTNLAGVPASITTSAGTPQSTTISTAFAGSLQAVVKDANNNPVGGVAVTFTVPTSGASAAFAGAASATVNTNASGVATAPALTANSQPGSYGVTAAASGVASKASFSLTNVAGSPASVSTTSGSSQNATVNAAFGNALQATVKDASNNLLSGVSVTFSAPAAGASATFGGSASISVTTNASGIATTPVPTANSQAGSYVVTASVSGVSTAASFSLANTAGAPASISASAGTPQSTTAGSTFVTALQATVKDASNNPLSGVTVTFTTPSPGASATFNGLSTASAVTNSNGIATAPALVANAQTGSYNVMASAAGIAATAAFALTNNSAIQTVPVGLVQQASGANLGNNQYTLGVSLGTAPQTGNLLILFFGQIGASQTITSISGATWTRVAQNNNNGDSEIWIGANPTSASITITGSNYFGKFQPGYAEVAEFAGVSTTLDGAAVDTAKGSWPVTTGHLSTSNASDLLVTTSLAYNGGGVNASIASPWTALKAPGGTYSLAAAYLSVNATSAYSATWSGTGSPQVPTILLALKATGPTGPSISVSAGTTQSATVNTVFAQALQATLVDSGGHPLSGATVTFSAPSSGATAVFGGASSAAAVTNNNGIATAPALTANGQAGSYNVTATSIGVSAPASFGLSNLAGPAASISANAGTPQSTSVSTAFPTALQATVKDANNNPVSGASVTFAVPASGASAVIAGAATVTTNASGVATASGLTANSQTGAYVVTAAVSGVAATASFNLTNAAATPASVTATVGTAQSVTVGAAFATALQATVKDVNGNPLSGVTVTFTAPSSGAGASFGGSSATASSTTNASGIATAPALTANLQAGGYTVTASVSGVAATANFGLSNLAGPAASISASAGTPQSTPVSTAFPTALQATVKDANNNPVSGASVSFAVPASGASAVIAGSATVTTNASGVATAPGLTANSQTGAYAVTATAGGVATAASFALSNTNAVVVPSISFVQQAAGANAGNNQNTLTVKLTGLPSSTNSLVLLFNQVSAAQTITSISGATWTRVAQNYTSNNGDSEVWIGTSPSSSTITITGTNSFGVFQPGYAIVAEFAGISATLDGPALLTTGGSWPVTTPTLTTTNAGDLLITSTLCHNGGGVGASILSPWVAFTAPGGNHSLAAAYRIASTTGAYSATWNGSGSPQVATISLAFK